MHYNILGFWQHLQNLPEGHEDRPSPRVCRLLLATFEKWQTKQPYPGWGVMGHLRDHVTNPDAVMRLHVSARRGLAMQKMLDIISGPYGQSHGICTIHPDELIVGTMPPYSVGQGKEIMRYHTDLEELQFEIQFLNAWSNFGHIIPNHQCVVERGLQSIIQECADRRERSADESRRAFYEGVGYALEGVIRFAERYAVLAETKAAEHVALLERYPHHAQRDIYELRIAGMQDVARRLRRIPAEPSQSFLDAVQCIFLMNCALHYTGELTSLGRLDQILISYLEDDLENDRITHEQAQEVIDCLWVKLDERVMLDNRHFEDRFTSADGALLGAGGASNFDQGALANQWMQQITVGGVKATNHDEPEDASNAVTIMCLQAARKFPFNCPTLGLRVHRDTHPDLLRLAARAILSGGAHPILLNDDKLVPALHERTGGHVELKSARNYASDGCFETIFPGETEFSFIYIPALDALEKTLNSGAGFGAAGGTYLRGMKFSWRTPPASDITDFNHFWEILEQHIWLNVNRQLAGILGAYGAKGSVCPTPILSAMIDGCIESGRDLYNGGARYHMFAPLMTGISSAADSFYVIKKLVFEDGAFTLEELVACLRSDWGKRDDMVGLKLPTHRIDEIKALCRAQPKFGSDAHEVDELAWRLIRSFVSAIERARNHEVHDAAWATLRATFGDDFEILLTPGVGTFEQYVFGGSFAGATPDGRHAGESVASDLSASPVYNDLDPIAQPEADGRPAVHAREVRLLEALDSWSDEAINLFSDGAPSDFNVREDFPEDHLVEILLAFADGRGSNIMTVTVANPETLRDAEKHPDAFNLVRVRMGGWTEYFSVLFPAHKAQHRRRPLYVP